PFGEPFVADHFPVLPGSVVVAELVGVAGSPTVDVVARRVRRRVRRYLEGQPVRGPGEGRRVDDGGEAEDGEGPFGPRQRPRGEGAGERLEGGARLGQRREGVAGAVGAVAQAIAIQVVDRWVAPPVAPAGLGPRVLAAAPRRPHGDPVPRNRVPREDVPLRA